MLLSNRLLRITGHLPAASRLVGCLLLVTVAAATGLEVYVNSQPIPSVVALLLVFLAGHGVPPVGNIIPFHLELCTLPARATRVRKTACASALSAPRSESWRLSCTPLLIRLFVSTELVHGSTLRRGTTTTNDGVFHSETLVLCHRSTSAAPNLASHLGHVWLLGWGMILLYHPRFIFAR